MRRSGWLILCAGLLLPILTQAQAQTPKLPNQLDYATEPFAMVRDSPECHLRILDGHASFGGDVTNPAQSCPDSFAWLLFAQAVSQHFWEDWSTDRQTWPSDPWPRCRPGEAPGQCCAGVEISNDAAPLHCPVYPGPTPGVPDDQVRQPVTAHQMSLTEATGRADTPWKDVPDSLKAPVIGALQDELIYRNEPMVDYVFDNELYFTEGLARVFRNAVTARAAYAPRWPAPPDPSAAHPAAPALIAIDFPIRAVMVKVNWLAADQAPRLGIDPNDTVHPFITMDLLPRATPTDPKPAKKRYLLLSFHISSKDVPNWTWATFEHVDNQGRCDFLGCNDSFGYLAAELPAQAGLAPPARNYIPPHHAEAVAQTDVEAFALAARYREAGRMSQGLVDLLASFAIAGGGTSDPSRPSQGDTAWRSYRLKGTQSDFVSATGVETRLGNSVTEAGFVNTSSCMTCHARAAITAEGLPAYSIFDRTMSDAGLAQSVNGTPNPAWFSVNAFFGDQGQREAPRQVAVQTDFVWGFRFACPIHESQYGPVWCKNVTKGYSQAVPARPN